MGAGIGIEFDQLVLVDQANGFAGQVHVVAHVGHGLGGYPVQRAIAFDFATDGAGQGGEGRNQFRTGCRLADEFGQGFPWIGAQQLWSAALQRLLGGLGDCGKLQ
ncbi:hypothetical protein D3C76_1197800 [compost metagenome]